MVITINTLHMAIFASEMQRQALCKGHWITVRTETPSNKNSNFLPRPWVLELTSIWTSGALDNKQKNPKTDYPLVHQNHYHSRQALNQQEPMNDIRSRETS